MLVYITLTLGFVGENEEIDCSRQYATRNVSERAREGGRARERGRTAACFQRNPLQTRGIYSIHQTSYQVLQMEKGTSIFSQVYMRYTYVYTLTWEGTNAKYRFLDLPSFSAFFVSQPLRTAPAPTVLMCTTTGVASHLKIVAGGKLKILFKSSFFLFDRLLLLDLLLSSAV